VKKIIMLGVILGLGISGTCAETAIPTPSYVGISLSKVMAALSGEQESLREEEAPAAILLYTADDRIGSALDKLKSQLKQYEQTRKVRIDFLTESHVLPDYTDDFLTHLEAASLEIVDDE
jgi:hypothetical protein